MALDLGTLSAKLKIDDAEFQKTLKGAPAQAKAAGDKTGRNFADGARPGMAKLGGLFAGLGIAKLTGDLLGFGLKTAMGMEKANIGFTTMLGSARKAKVFLDQLKAFAAKTPFEFPELQTAASSLISAGIHASKVIPIMTTLGNVTSGMGTGAEGVRRATIALQQMTAAGKITGEDLNQLRDAGIPVYDLLAAATGRSKAEVVKLAQAGKLGGKDLAAMMKALETGKGLERFNGLMDKQSQSLEGIISTLKDTVGQGLADALTPMIPSIKEGIGAFTKALPGILAGIRDFGKWVVKNQTWLVHMAVILGVTAAAFGILNVVMAANPFSLIVIAIGALVAGLVWCYDNVTWFRDGINAAFKFIGDFGRYLWNNALGPILKAIVGGFAWVIEGLANMLDGLGNVPGFGWAKDAAKNLHNMAKGAREAADNIKPIADPALKGSAAVNKLDKSIKGLKSKIVTAKAKGDDKELKKLEAQLKAAEKKKHKILIAVDAQLHNEHIQLNLSRGGKTGALRMYAAGGRFPAGQLAMVGEMGPELVRFNSSGQVYNNRQTASMLSGSGGGPGGGTTINVVVHVPVNADVMATGRALESVLDKYLINSGKTQLAFARG